MRILLTNDDGLHAAGLAALRRALASLGEVSVVVPMRECSAGGHAISTASALPVREAPLAGGLAHVVDGTPADCVKLALSEILPAPPDLVVSGINHGANVGICVLYSGTVSAALEGAIAGIPSFAVSALLRDGFSPPFDAIARRFARLAADILDRGARPGVVYNVNFPDRHPAKARPVRWTPQSRTVPFHDHYVRRLDPRGRPYYWLKEHPALEKAEPDTDVSCLRRGHVTVTPLTCDLTHHDLLRAAAAARRDGGRHGTTS